MGLVVMFIASWLAIFIFYSFQERLTILENAFVFLVSLTLVINASWIIAEELKLVELTKDGVAYTGFILNRSVGVPMIFVIAMNAVFRAKRVWTALASVAVVLAALVGLNGLGVYFEIAKYEKWNLGYDAISYAALLAIVYGLLRLYRKTVYRRTPS
ncbi:hypothetical protein FE782_25820 [Paenibacillus antri]|uniref:Uncharacterized protein n=1 Tax=Paenibacillus antri TaxID=2582848 RepID=A0A5R9FYY7_9BACL|nr:hypothetical protein [Paenibacillus antri]TLS49277.1 hypothetical protein FE782_25820 [Paenibacillus antri]